MQGIVIVEWWMFKEITRASFFFKKLSILCS
jgi:hypothetical protein